MTTSNSNWKWDYCGDRDLNLLVCSKYVGEIEYHFYIDKDLSLEVVYLSESHDIAQCDSLQKAKQIAQSYYDYLREQLSIKTKYDALKTSALQKLEREYLETAFKVLGKYIVQKSTEK